MKYHCFSISKKPPREEWENLTTDSFEDAKKWFEYEVFVNAREKHRCFAEVRVYVTEDECNYNPIMSDETGEAIYYS